MTRGASHLDRRRLRAPEEDRAVFVAPPFREVAEVLDANLLRRRETCYDLQGRCLSEVSRESRAELLQGARRWTARYRDVPPAADDASRPILLAGHQPQLFHPGVWFKNFALGALAQRHGAVAVNLIIDSDTLKRPQVRVPGGSVEAPQVAQIPLDRPGPVVPYEERTILDEAVFRRFGRRAAEQIAPLVDDPLVRDYWPMVVDRMHQTGNLGACLAESRHRLEGRWGVQTLEIPQSRVCASRPHGWFVAHLIAQLPRFRQVYNEAVEEYRRAHKIRSAAHPVPNLAEEGPWIEAPFWIWSGADPRRRRLFAGRRAREIVLTDRRGLEIALPLTPEGDASRAVERLAELPGEGIRIRCRALATTLFARLVLGDLFLHGIGGAKYDRVTDAVMERFFGIEPPRFLVLSATLHLPVEHARASPDQLRTIDRRLRDLTYHPEWSITGSTEGADGRGEEVGRLLEAKRRWIDAESTPENARRRYVEIRRINQSLQPHVAPLRRELGSERRRVERALAAEAILSRRDYAFCLFPQETLREFFCARLPKSGQIGFDES